MSIDKYILTLKPLIAKKDVLNDIDYTKSLIDDIVLKGLEGAAEVMSKNDLQDRSLKGREEQYFRMVRGQNKNGMFGAMAEVFTNMQECLDVVGKQVEQRFPSELATEGITYNQAAFLRYMDLAAFSVGYVQDFLRYAYKVEEGALKKEDLTKTLSRGELRRVEDGWLGFLQAMRFLSTKAADLDKALKKTPDLNVRNSDYGMLAHVHGETTVDPVQQNFIGTRWNLIYHFLVKIAEFQASRYTAAKEMLRQYEVQRANIEKLRKGERDASLEARVVELDGIIEELKYKITEMEKKYAS